MILYFSANRAGPEHERRAIGGCSGDDGCRHSAAVRQSLLLSTVADSRRRRLNPHRRSARLRRRLHYSQQYDPLGRPVRYPFPLLDTHPITDHYSIIVSDLYPGQLSRISLRNSSTIR